MAGVIGGRGFGGGGDVTNEGLHSEAAGYQFEKFTNCPIY